ncbi:hypothetical protein [Spirosoma arcticum]
MITLLSVAYQRHRHLDDLRIDLQRNFHRQESQIKDLKVRLEDCDTVQNGVPTDTSWALPVADSMRVPGRVESSGSR